MRAPSDLTAYIGDWGVMLAAFVVAVGAQPVMAQDSDDYDVTIEADRISELQMGDAPGNVTIDRNEEGEVKVDTEWGVFTNASESQKIDIRLTDETEVDDADFDLVEDLMDEERFTLTADAKDGPESVTTHAPEFGEGDDGSQ